MLGTERADLATSSINSAKFQMLRWSLWTLSVLAVIFDAPLQYLLNRIGFPSIASWVIGLTASLVALGICIATHGIAHAATFDPIRPRRSVRICLTLAGLLGAVALAALTLLLYARTANGDVVPYIASLVSTAMWVLGKSLPVLGGLVSAAAHTLSYPTILDRRIQWAKKLLGDFERFTDWLQSEREKITPPRAEAGRRSLIGTLLTFFVLAYVLQGILKSPASPRQRSSEQRDDRCDTTVRYRSHRYRI